VPAQKLTLVPNGVDIDHFKSRPPDFRYSELWRAPGKKVIGFIGSFFKYEGIDLLLEAVAGLTAARSDIGLVLAGGGRTEAELKNQVERLRLTDRVIMPGQIPHESIPSVYSVCDILAYPRYASRLTELTTPLKPLEAMAMGKPVVASDIGGHRELIQHGRTGLLFGPGEAPSLAEAISRLLDNPALGRALGTRASIWARQTRAWDKIAGIYTDVYAKAGYLRRPRIAES
jgi:glycosyltransferase involved in cell wall biosynthesis